MPSIYTYISEKSWRLILRMPIFERFGKLNCDHLSNSTFSLASLSALSAVKFNNFHGKKPSVSIDVVRKVGIVFKNGFEIRPKRARNFQKEGGTMNFVLALINLF